MDNDIKRFNFLCDKFNKEVFHKKYNELENLIKEIEKNYPKEKSITEYFKVVIEFYKNFTNSLKSYDNLSLSNTFNKYLSEGYYYSIKIKSKQQIRVNLDIQYPWTVLNPSIIKDEDNFIMNIRSSNYRILPGGNYVSLEEDKVIRTRNFIRIMDLSFTEIKTYEIIEPDRFLKRNWGIKGFEDIRIFKFKDQLKFLTATYDTHNLNIQRVSQADIVNEKIVNIINLNIPGVKKITEKNWLPFQYEEKVGNGVTKIYCVYSYSPFIILDITNTSKIKIASNLKVEYNFTSFRGSASPIKYKDGYICLIHQVYTETDNRKIYTNRLIYFEEFIIKKISHQFYFQKHQIEFCCGMCISNDDFIFTYGVNDEEAYISVIDKGIIDEMIYSI